MKLTGFEVFRNGARLASKSRVPTIPIPRRVPKMPPAETAPLIYSDDEEAGSPGVRRVRRSRERARPGLPTSDGLWTPTEKWLGASSVFLLLLACIFGGLFVAGPRADLPPPPPPKAPDREAPCVTPDCVLVAAGIIASIDFNIDPCDDFYSFACGGWIATNPIPAHKSRYGTFDQLAEANRKVLQNILESPYSVSPSVPRGGRDADKNNFDKMVGIYNSCMNETDIRVKAIQPVRDLLAKTRNELFPVPELNSSKFGEVIGNLHNLDLGPLFGFGVDADLKDPDKNTLYLDQGGLGLPSREYYKDEKIVAVYEVR